MLQNSLWPEPVRRVLKTGSDREVVATYARRSDMPRERFRDLLAGARRRIWLGGYTSYFLWLEVPGAANTLARAAESGVDVRVLLGDPDSPVTVGRDQVEQSPLTLATRIAITQAELGKVEAPVPVRFTDRHIAMSVWVFDDQAIVATHIGAELGQESVTFHFRRRMDGGPFDRYAAHFESLWSAAGERE